MLKFSNFAVIKLPAPIDFVAFQSICNWL